VVVKRRLLLAVASALTLVLTASAPMIAGTREARPAPLRSNGLVRVKDIAANGVSAKGPIVAVGYQETGSPGQLYVAFSTDGGKDYRRTNGNLRRYPIVGIPNLGMSLDICAGRVWAATGYRSPTDKAGDSDVFLTSRTIGGGAAQALMTSTSDDRRIRDATVTCVGGDLIAIGWLQRSGGKSSARLMIRSVEPLGSTPSIKQTFDLGRAELGSGLDVAATPASVAVSFIRGGNLRIKRFTIGGDNSITPVPIKTIAWNDVKFPETKARGKRLVVAYSDAGKVRVKTSRDLGDSFASARTLANTGGVKNPSVPWSIDVAGDRLVATVGAYDKANGKLAPMRMTSSTYGARWSKRTFGNTGARVAAFLKRPNLPSKLQEAWHNNAPKKAPDTLRARYEL
jgi:hypothetical protein